MSLTSLGSDIHVSIHTLRDKLRGVMGEYRALEETSRVKQQQQREKEKEKEKES
eukprot:gene30142-37308_t